MARPSFSVGKIIPGLRRYCSEIVAEHRKVVWPTRDEVIRLTELVIAIAGSVAVLLAVFDYGFTKLIELILKA